MSLWYDKNKRGYASNGHGSWIKLYAEHLFDVLKEELFSKFAGHYAGNEGKHQAEDVLCDGSSVKEKLDEICRDMDGKVDKSSGMGLSQNSYSDADKNKLAGIEAGAEVNLVKSVAGKTGNITLSKSDIGLDKVNNTADTDKPVSKPVQNALKLKEDKPTIIDLTEYNLTIEDILKGNYLDNLFEGNYLIKYGFTRIEDQIDYSEYNYATLRTYKEYSDLALHNIRCLQEISFSVTNNDATDDTLCYIQQKYTRIYSIFRNTLGWSEWKKDISYQEIVCEGNLLSTNLLDNCFSPDGQLEKYVIRDPRNNQIRGELTVFFAGAKSNGDSEFRFYTQILEDFGNYDFYAPKRKVFKYARTYGRYEDDNAGTPQLIEDWSEWSSLGSDILTLPADTKNIALINNREYYLTGTTDLSLTFPTDKFECWLSVTFANTGTVSLNFPENARYIGYAPLPSNGETWEISVKNGVVVGAKVGEGNE